MPRVALPLVDRIADEDRTAIVRNVAALVAPAADRAAERAWWDALFADWYPADEPAPDGDPVPTWDLEVLRDTVNAFAEQDVEAAYGQRDAARAEADAANEARIKAERAEQSAHDARAELVRARAELTGQRETHRAQLAQAERAARERLDALEEARAQTLVRAERAEAQLDRLQAELDALRAERA